MEFFEMLSTLVLREGSDLFITVGRPPSIMVDGNLYPLVEASLNRQQASELVLQTMADKERRQFEGHRECNYALQVDGIGRFRISAFVQRGQTGMVVRRINTRIPTTAELNLPPILEQLAMARRGMVIIVGSTGAGKSCTLASMIGHRNRTAPGHIVTVEDPIEFVHDHDCCIVTQREVGVDTESYDIALRNALRQAPNVIVIGEVRSRETMSQAITFAETGHLCLTTLHANNANQALERITRFFPDDYRSQLLMDLSLNLKAIMAQQLIPLKQGAGRMPAVELLLNTPLASDLIRKGELHKLKSLMTDSNELGMRSFDQDLYRLYRSGHISLRNALAYADSENEVRLMIKLGGTDGLNELLRSVNQVEILGGEAEEMLLGKGPRIRGR